MWVSMCAWERESAFIKISKEKNWDGWVGGEKKKGKDKM